jgi:TIR domain
LSNPKWDAFICHASEDKVQVVRPLAEALTNLGLNVWYDEFTLKVLVPYLAWYKRLNVSIVCNTHASFCLIQNNVVKE